LTGQSVGILYTFESARQNSTISLKTNTKTTLGPLKIGRIGGFCPESAPKSVGILYTFEHGHRGENNQPIEIEQFYRVGMIPA
jgi:hypothetical protein